MPGIVLRRELEIVEEKGETDKHPEIWDSDGNRHAFAKQVLYGDEVDGLGCGSVAPFVCSIRMGL
ncbi:TPA: hypothetical protein DCE37_11160 [Candidatus Latescibacteria bacterium]|nr:hypothetical protein [Gemmatimonadota bacterium]HAA75669.1 hypothetical protein [Candidatus Latescibacterota bacterium]|tara:strand:+ start:326 stop:520 length:195 start_codon:yes stop_codon:yes gene_type:complete